jgi:hypothetical protein
MVSYHSLPLSSIFRVTDPRERARGTGESCLRCRILRSGLRGVAATSLPQPFPSHLGLSARRSATNFHPSPTISVLSMNCSHFSRNFAANNELIFTGLFTETLSTLR